MPYTIIAGLIFIFFYFFKDTHVNMRLMKCCNKKKRFQITLIEAYRFIGIFDEDQKQSK